MKKIMVMIGLLFFVQSVFADRVESLDGVMRHGIFKLKRSNIEEMKKILVPMLTEKGSMLVDPDANTIVIKDIKDNVGVMEAKINELEGILPILPEPIKPVVK